jgi:hypothetical protein
MVQQHSNQGPPRQQAHHLLPTLPLPRAGSRSNSKQRRLQQAEHQGLQAPLGCSNSQVHKQGTLLRKVLVLELHLVSRVRQAQQQLGVGHLPAGHQQHQAP